ncbi:MAG TPA: NAD(P)/FAD-dependent oxidoreductase [Steroidobacteraceae bacterium]|nr:NAD(P)/FAD-dependent oxidoreductase [Steroidobacteraceae bacterium]
MAAWYDAVVIGAGPAGSSAAILLARAGRAVALIEARPYPRRKVCGECIAASNLPLLRALGVGEALRRLAGPELRRVAFWCGEETATGALPACTEGDFPWGCALGREHLDLLLLERARATGAAIFQPARALSVRARGRGAGYDIDAAHAGLKLTLSAPVVVRAHGSWEPPPADAAPRRVERRGSDLLAFKASFRGAALEDGLLPVLAFDGGYGGMVVAGDGLATLACCIRRDRLASCRRDGPAGARAGEAIEALLRRECRGVREALAHADRVGSWLAAGPLRPGVRLGGAGDGTFPIGNAAGEVHPIVGEGISMALQSAHLLCEELAGSTEAFRRDEPGEASRQEIRARYRSRWRAHFSRRMRLAACFAHAAMRPGMAASLLPLLRRSPALLGMAARLSGKTRSAVTPCEALPGPIQGSSP